MVVLTSAFAFALSLGSTLGASLHYRQDNVLTNPWPASLIGMGDSFAAGPGAGMYFQPAVGDVKSCKRFAGGYPARVRSLVQPRTFDFTACTGAVIKDMGKQHTLLKDKRADVVTLSLSGNDFLFSKVVRACIYNAGIKWIGKGDAAKNKECTDALDVSEKLVKGETGDIFEQLGSAIDKIFHDRLALALDGESLIVITGYARFFADAQEGDPCSGLRMFIPNVASGIVGNLVLKETRDRMNTLVKMVNDRIQSEIVSRRPSTIKFVDIDPAFDGHRFCEQNTPAPNHPVPSAQGGDDDSVWFISFDTTLQETDFVGGDTQDEQDWVAWKQGLHEGGGNDLGPSVLQESSTFHPKSVAHQRTAELVRDAIRAWDEPRAPTCQNSDAGRIPPKIHTDLVGMETQTPNQLLYRIREVLCNADPFKRCDFPAGMGRAAAVSSAQFGRCEISIGVASGPDSDPVEMYMIRGQSIDKEGAQLQHCWDQTEKIIEQCVKNANGKGFAAGKHSRPAYYEAGIRKLNSGKHEMIPPLLALKPEVQAAAPPSPPPPKPFPDPSFTSVCGNDPGPCQENGCTGVSFICTDGKYKGCYCGSDSRFGMFEGPKHKLECANDCCDSAANQAVWFLPNWCNANCGGFSSSAKCYQA